MNNFGKFRSKSEAPAEPKMQPMRVDDEIKSDVTRKRGRHGQMVDLLSAEDRAALNLNKYESSYTLAQLQDKIKRQSDQYKPEFKIHF